MTSQASRRIKSRNPFINSPSICVLIYFFGLRRTLLIHILFDGKMGFIGKNKHSRIICDMIEDLGLSITLNVKVQVVDPF